MSSFSANAVFKPTKTKDLIKAVKEYINDNTVALNKYGPIGTWDISGLKSMNKVFMNIPITDRNVHLLKGIEKWDTSNVTSMESLFSGVEANSIPYISKWNTGNVQNMAFMFQNSNCDQPLKWDTSKVTNMAFLFHNSKFNHPLNWDTSKVTNMKGMFSRSWFNAPLDHWDVSNVVDMSYMFENARFTQPLNSWNVSKVKNMSYMFSKTWNFDEPLDNWDVSNVDDFSNMFEGARMFRQNISNWVDKIKDDAITTNMFYNCDFLEPENNPLVLVDENKLEEKRRRETFREQQKELASKQVIPTIDNTKFPDCCICQEPLNNIDGPELAESCGGEHCRDVIRVCGPTAPHFMHRGCAMLWVSPPVVNTSAQMGYDEYDDFDPQKRANKCPLCSKSMSNNLMDQPQVPNDEILRETYKGGKRKRKTQKRKTQKRKSSRRTTKKRQYK